MSDFSNLSLQDAYALVMADAPERTQQRAQGWAEARDALTAARSALAANRGPIADGWNSDAGRAFVTRIDNLLANLATQIGVADANAQAWADAAAMSNWVKTTIKGLQDGLIPAVNAYVADPRNAVVSSTPPAVVSGSAVVVPTGMAMAGNVGATTASYAPKASCNAAIINGR